VFPGRGWQRGVLHCELWENDKYVCRQWLVYDERKEVIENFWQVVTDG